MTRVHLIFERDERLQLCLVIWVISAFRVNGTGLHSIFPQLLSRYVYNISTNTHRNCSVNITVLCYLCISPNNIKNISFSDCYFCKEIKTHMYASLKWVVIGLVNGMVQNHYMNQRRLSVKKLRRNVNTKKTFLTCNVLPIFYFFWVSFQTCNSYNREVNADNKAVTYIVLTCFNCKIRLFFMDVYLHIMITHMTLIAKMCQFT